ncbi:hypothetical protein BN14_08844 [Rhizoctonia solani AG-1 IB]|uniref:Jacalin-type lectin domain-containing protein n=1 Tax=Thanatephorus cucumeris (strain AG1-IB / isolate 7/3/14) TaxID=1108050 RepID=M5CFH2_THACB|nr:hypothetical protein BN14_08844 [Rhizoctonia solani AG-1 IB]
MITRSAPRGAELPLGFDGASAGVKDIGQVKIWYDVNGMKDLAIVYTDGTETGPYGFGKVPANKVSDTFILAPGEFITNIFVWNNPTAIKALQLVKNTYEVSQRYGDSTDANWPTLWKEGGSALVGMSGSYDANWLTQLQPVWRSDVKANNHRDFELTYINNGNTKQFGQAAGTEFVQDPPSKGMVLCFFIGSCGGYIQSLILAWGPPPE